jgi:phosphate transport system permease protein
MTETVTADQTSGRSRATAYVRPKQTSAAVRWADRIADFVISAGGLFVILAVAGIMVFLVQVVVPLFGGGSITARLDHRLAAQPTPSVAVLVDETNLIAVDVFASGETRAVHVPTGTVLRSTMLPLEGKAITAFSRSTRTDDFALGFADGSVRFGEIGMRSQVVKTSELPVGLQRLNEADLTDGESVFHRIDAAQHRRVRFDALLGPAQAVSDRSIVQLDYRIGGTVERPTRSFLTKDANNTLRLTRAETRVNLLTRRETTTLDTATLPAIGSGSVVGALMTAQADQVYIARESGEVLRFDTRNFQNPTLIETRQVVSGGAKLTAMAFLIGEQALVVGGSDGSVNVFFRVEDSVARTNDRHGLKLAHALEPQPAAITHIAVSSRNKSFATADSSGQVWVRHSTSSRLLLDLGKSDGGAIASLAISPRTDGVVATSPVGGLKFWGIDVPHPETNLATIFGKVWYEGAPEPTFTWQSSSGNDEFEPKLSLVPLIFGTIKATIYSLLFAVPIALAAAIFTSQFVHHSVRAVVKPAMEMMASLPSVVLGFIAALILAPIVESFIAAVVLVFVALPLSLFVAAYLWQLLPQPVALRYDGLPKFTLMFVVLFGGCYAAYGLAPGFERLFFAGDFRGWVNGALGSGRPFLFLLLLPLAFVAAAAVVRRALAGEFRKRVRSLGRVRGGAIELVRWLVTIGGAVVLALVLAYVLSAAGLDPRGGVFDTYVQRNTFVVGLAMGFAVIPIIYTIAEDAMSAVPEHLRAASLACGATVWQTATRVVVPTAVSGVFAAVMIGMGRAVGETMIVVMAAGNTPILDWNLFNGLRALSANIAVELPEAVVGSTLYRMLFLAALTLFVMTFILNTIAEVIRQRFRKRAVQL